VKRYSGPAAIVGAALALSFVLFPAAAPGTVHINLGRTPLTPLTHSLPAARSGQPYLWTLKAEGGTPPYHCLPKSLGVGTIKLLRSCKITGVAPVVASMRVTGPFLFKVQDSSSPKKTSQFLTMNFTVRGPLKVVPPAPDGFQLLASANGNDANGGAAQPNDVTLDNPLFVDIRVTGWNKVSTDVVLSCWASASSSIVEVDRTFAGDGLFNIPVPAGTSKCYVQVTSSAIDLSIKILSFTVQVYAQGGTVSPPPPPGGHVVDAVTPASTTLGSAGGCPGGTLTATFQVAAASNVSWTAAGDPNSNGPGQVSASGGSGSGSATVTINVAPQTNPTFGCGYTVAMGAFNNVYVKFSDGAVIGVTVYWTYTFVE